jgi:tetratricopeptide (TPR) repeat protein
MSTDRYATGLTEDQRVELARDRQKELRTIRKGDYLLLQNNAIEAISLYTQVLERIPDDIVVRRKLAHVYFLTHNWKSAYQNYTLVPFSEMREDDQRELFWSLFFDTDRHDQVVELEKYTLDQSTRDYYTTLSTCLSGIHNCIVSIESYTGTSLQIIQLQKVIQKSTTISPDFQYRNFLVATEFYTLGAYSITTLLASEILWSRPNYIEVRKLSGFALYELGRYTEAWDMLRSYIWQKPTDTESILRLADIQSRLWDATNAILYYNNAITAGVKNKTDTERRLAREYAKVGDLPSMLRVLSYLVSEPDANEADMAVAVSMALESWENTKAYMWSYMAIQRYPDAPLLTPLYLRSLRVNGRSSEVIDVFHALSDERAVEPLVALEYAQSLITLSRSPEALPILTHIRDTDPEMEWWVMAGELLRSIQ